MQTIKSSSERIGLDETFVGYEWNAWADFLIAHLVPKATVIPAVVTQPIEEILSAVPECARTFLCHLDCTITRNFPLCRSELIDALEIRGIRVLNRSVSDISKRTLQATCKGLGLKATIAPSEGNPDQLLIVKSNLNFGGKNEKFLAPEDRKLLGLGGLPTLIKGPYEYPVLPRKEIPLEWWSEDSLNIEIYIDNARHLYYRCWFFLDRVLLIEMSNPRKVKKMGDSRLTRQWYIQVEDEEVTAVSSTDYPPALLGALTHFRERFELDYGTVDAVVDDEGTPYIIDVNTTPYFNVKLPIPHLLPFLRWDESVRRNIFAAQSRAE